MSRSLIAIQVLIVIAILAGVTFSRRGLLDLRKFSNQIENVRQRVSQVEEENRKLKLQANLFSHPNAQITESQIRNSLGWARADEFVYLEKR